MDKVMGAAERLKDALPQQTPQQRIAAQFLLDHPKQRLGSLRQVASHAYVTPNTLVRLAQALGYEGFDSLREELIAQQAQQASSPLERPDWLDAIADNSTAGQLLRSVADSSLSNLERTFLDADPAKIEATAKLMLNARAVHVMGLGTLQPVAKLFATLAGVFMDGVQAIPTETALPVDSIAHAQKGDVLFAMTFSPYRREVVEAVQLAADKGLKLVLLTDSWKSPIATQPGHVYMLPATAPHVFASVISVVAFVEVLLAFLTKHGGKKAAASIKSFHENRFNLGVYWRDKPGPNDSQN